MRRVVLQMRLSVDGFVANLNGEEDWGVPPDDEVFNLIDSLPDKADTLLIGRKMAEGFIPHFENFPADHPKSAFAQKMVNLPKVIFSNTLTAPFGKNATLAKGSLAATITELKQADGKNILVYGGANFVSALIAGGHIDEFYLLVMPVMMGKGIRIFDLPDNRHALTLYTAKAFNNGISLLHYGKKHGA
jgi:dihydrofolate reductase